jgi:peptidyl-prolyl cis-trans isomerase D
MRKHAQSWLIKVLIAIIAAVFVFYFGYSFTAKRALKTAYVNGDLITSDEYRKTYFELIDMFRMQYKDLWNDDLMKTLDIKNVALKNLINQRLISQEARRLGLDVTEKEIQQAVMDYEAFKIDGRFDMGRYQALLSRNRMKPEDFEETLRQDLLNRKLRLFLSSFSGVTEQEVLQNYTYTNEKIEVSFVQFKPDNFEESVEPDEAAIKDFFDEHKEEYRIPEKIKIAYLEIDPKIFEQGIEISDDEIESYYEYNIDTYAEPKKVKARHILFKLDKNAQEDKETQVKEKAQSVLKEAREGKDFAELAKKYSEGPTKSKGGDLGYFSSGQMVKPFEDAAFKMKTGEISELIRTDFGYHIIKVEDVQEASNKSLEEVRDKIEKTLVRNTTVELAYEKGQTLIDQMPYDIELAQYAAEHDMNTKSTDYVTEGERIPGVGGDSKLSQTIFSLSEKETSELIELGEKYYIFQVAERKASYLPEMEDVAEKVKEGFIDHLAAGEAKAAAEGFLAELQKGKTWDEIAGEKQLKTEKTDFFTRRGSIPKVGYAPELQETLFRLNENKRYPDTVFENNKGSFVFRWEAYEGADEEKFQGEKEKQRHSMMQQKSSRLFESWLDSLNKKADIEIITPP